MKSKGETPEEHRIIEEGMARLNPKAPKEDWENEFASLWEMSFDNNGDKNVYEYNQLLGFIRTEIAAAREEGWKMGVQCGHEVNALLKIEARTKTRHELLTEIGEWAKEVKQHNPAPNLTAKSARTLVLEELLAYLKSLKT